jgi:energy-coupling factor transport system ATP-binding protein
VARGECAGVFGRNGAGKSTLLLVAGGALAPSAGRVERRAGGRVLYLPQSPEQLFFTETVHEEIAFGLRRARARSSSAEIDARVAESLRAVGFDPNEVMPRSPFELSFGEMRRVAFAVAHSLSPDLLLLDEPASCLDGAGRGVLDRLIAARLDAGAAVVVASHDGDHLRRACDRVVELRDGRVHA